MNNDLLSFLKTRRSVKIPNLVEPAPSADQIEEMLSVAARVPDHGKLAPWRFIVIAGDARKEAGKLLREAYQAEHPQETDEERLDFESRTFTRAPLVIAVVSTIKDGKPEWEQILSSAIACYNLELAASALGFSSDWLSEWYSYSDHFKKAMNLSENERFAGFINIGTMKRKPDERERPDLSQIVTYWGS